MSDMFIGTLTPLVGMCEAAQEGNTQALQSKAEIFDDHAHSLLNVSTQRTIIIICTIKEDAQVNYFKVSSSTSCLSPKFDMYAACINSSCFIHKTSQDFRVLSLKVLCSLVLYAHHSVLHFAFAFYICRTFCCRAHWLRMGNVIKLSTVLQEMSTFSFLRFGFS